MYVTHLHQNGIRRRDRLKHIPTNILQIFTIHYLFEFQPMTPAPDDNYLSLNQTLIGFWCRQGLNPKSLIQPLKTLLVELIGTHTGHYPYYLYITKKNTCRNLFLKIDNTWSNGYFLYITPHYIIFIFSRIAWVCG